MSEIICGKNAVIQSIKSGMNINRVLIAENIDENFVAAVLRLCREHQIPVRRLSKNKLSQIAGSDHRGIAAEMAAAVYADIEDMLAAAQENNQQPLILLLDGVEDPHNLGAIIRSAYCLGAHGLIIPSRRSASVNQTVLKTSAGAAAHLPIARVGNLNQALDKLQKAGLWAAAVDMDGESLWHSDLGGPLLLVLGSEGSGLSPLLKKNCDLTVAIPMADNQVGSLNVSNAAAVMLAEIARQRAGAIK
jgi:23S rRNA (guanosine2251-2'-O)-methyltransferase